MRSVLCQSPTHDLGFPAPDQKKHSPLFSFKSAALISGWTGSCTGFPILCKRTVMYFSSTALRFNGTTSLFHPRPRGRESSDVVPRRVCKKCAEKVMGNSEIGGSYLASLKSFPIDAA
jgi:hypothetical protein